MKVHSSLSSFWGVLILFSHYPFLSSLAHEKLNLIYRNWISWRWQCQPFLLVCPLLFPAGLGVWQFPFLSQSWFSPVLAGKLPLVPGVMIHMLETIFSVPAKMDIHIYILFSLLIQNHSHLPLSVSSTPSPSLLPVFLVFVFVLSGTGLPKTKGTSFYYDEDLAVSLSW